MSNFFDMMSKKTYAHDVKNLRHREKLWRTRKNARGSCRSCPRPSFVIIGAVAAMLMAMAGWDRFWIANVIYLCFFLSAILGSITKIIAYRKPFQQW